MKFQSIVSIISTTALLTAVGAISFSTFANAGSYFNELNKEYKKNNDTQKVTEVREKIDSLKEEMLEKLVRSARDLKL